MAECGHAYDSHAWVWESGARRCERCGLVDLSAAHLLRRVRARLRRRARPPD